MNKSMNHNPNTPAVGVRSTLLATAICLVGLSVFGQSVIPPSEKPFDKSYSQWSAAWWQWMFSLPVTANPQFDTADCSAGQHGQVWFLAGTFSSGAISRKCTVPASKALFFPVANAWADNTGCAGSACPPTSNSASQLAAIAKSIQDSAIGLSCTIDGRPVHGLSNQSAYRVTANFSYTLPNDPNNVINYFVLNFCGAALPGCYASGGTVSPAATDGVWVMLAPLEAGKHTIHFTAASPGLDITSHLTVLEDNAQ
jgi:hypothetical protein